MTFDDIALDPLTLRAAERLSEHLQILGDSAPKGREHWSACLKMFVRIHTAQTMVTTPLTVDDIIPASDRVALATLQPDAHVPPPKVNKERVIKRTFIKKRQNHTKNFEFV